MVVTLSNHQRLSLSLLLSKTVLGTPNRPVSIVVQPQAGRQLGPRQERKASTTPLKLRWVGLLSDENHQLRRQMTKCWAVSTDTKIGEMLLSHSLSYRVPRREWDISNPQPQRI